MSETELESFIVDEKNVEVLRFVIIFLSCGLEGIFPPTLFI